MAQICMGKWTERTDEQSERLRGVRETFTKKNKEEMGLVPREGAFIHGLYMEGARWDVNLGTITESRLKELYPLMPVIHVRAVTQDKQEMRNLYECPVYNTRLHKQLWLYIGPCSYCNVIATA